MTKTIKLFLSVIFLGVLVTSSCKKYPDGPLLSLRTKKHRLAGKWDVEYFSINGHDSTNYLKSKNFYGMYEFLQRHDSDVCYYWSNIDIYSYRGFWQFRDGSQNLFIKYTSNSLYSEHLGPYRDQEVLWEIRRLTEKELWLKTIYTDGREYFVKFKLFKNN
jgi:hypothetical protein